MGRLLEPGGGDILLVAGLQEFNGHEERKKGFRTRPNRKDWGRVFWSRERFPIPA